MSIELKAEMNEPPKRRITIPEGSVALILNNQLALELRAVLQIIRRRQVRARNDEVNIESMRAVASDVLLVMLDDKQFDELYVNDLFKKSQDGQ